MKRKRGREEDFKEKDLHDLKIPAVIELTEIEEESYETYSNKGINEVKTGNNDRQRGNVQGIFSTYFVHNTLIRRPENETFFDSPGNSQ